MDLDSPAATVPSGRALDRRILALALPVLATLAADPLYACSPTPPSSDTSAPPRSGCRDRQRGAGAPATIFIFLMFGTTAAVSRLIGSGRPDDAAAHALQALWLALGLGVAVAVLLIPLGLPLLSLFGADGDVTHAAHVYFTVSLAGLPAFLIVMAAVGYLRGTQDTRTPLYVACGTVVLNLVLEVVAIYVLGFGVGASALGHGDREVGGGTRARRSRDPRRAPAGAASVSPPGGHRTCGRSGMAAVRPNRRSPAVVRGIHRRRRADVEG